MADKLLMKMFVNISNSVILGGMWLKFSSSLFNHIPCIFSHAVLKAKRWEKRRKKKKKSQSSDESLLCWGFLSKTGHPLHNTMLTCSLKGSYSYK